MARPQGAETSTISAAHDFAYSSSSALGSVTLLVPAPAHASPLLVACRASSRCSPISVHAGQVQCAPGFKQLDTGPATACPSSATSAAQHQICSSGSVLAALFRMPPPAVQQGLAYRPDASSSKPIDMTYLLHEIVDRVVIVLLCGDGR